jgi:hypothetical protein
VLALSEMRHRNSRRGSSPPPWLLDWLLDLAIGVQVDHMFGKIRLSRARGSFLVALAVLAAVMLEIGGSLAGPYGLPFRLIAPEIAAACAGMLTGRAMAIAMRWRGALHVDLHRL